MDKITTRNTAAFWPTLYRREERSKPCSAESKPVSCGFQSDWSRCVWQSLWRFTAQWAWWNHQQPTSRCQGFVHDLLLELKSACHKLTSQNGLLPNTKYTVGSAGTYLRCGGKYYAVLLEISSPFQQWKNFENRLRFEKVIAKSLVASLFWNTV